MIKLMLFDHKIEEREMIMFQMIYKLLFCATMFSLLYPFVLKFFYAFTLHN